MKKNVIIIGYSPLVKDLIEDQVRDKYSVMRFEGIIANIEDKFIAVGEGGHSSRIPVIGNIDDLPDILATNSSDVKPMLVLAVGEERDNNILQKISQCIGRGYDIYEILDIYEMVTGKVPVMHVHEHWLLRAFNKPRIGYRVFKRIMDVIVAVTSIVVLFPSFMIITLLIKLTSRGPILYKQCRVGRGGKEFVIYKFRTMVNDAEDNDAVWAVKDDPRITRFGRWLRKLRLDEMPQLFNVLRGEMSIIGPRPERPEFVRKLSEDIPFYNYRHIVKPGITGWAQVKYCYACSVEGSLQKLQYDLYGVRYASVEYDIEVLFRTMWVMLSGAGAH